MGALLLDLPKDVREGADRRNFVATSGICSCGARMTLPSCAERRRLARHGKLIRVNAVQDNDCPAVGSNLRDAVNRWWR